MSERRGRGVRLSDLDKSKVYRIAFVGRRWEVVGAEGAPDSAGPAQGGVTDARDGVPRTGAPYSPRHAAAAPSAP